MKTGTLGWRGFRAAAVCSALATAGCFQPESVTPAQLTRGLLVMLPGIEGSPSQFAETCKGLREAGVDCAIKIHDWNRGPFGSLVNLTDLEGNRRRAATSVGSPGPGPARSSPRRFAADRRAISPATRSALGTLRPGAS